MISEAGRHGWRAQVPLVGSVIGSTLAEAVVGPADIVGRTNQPHPSREDRLGASDGTAATGEWREMGAESGVQALDVGGVDDRTGGGRGQDRLDPRQGAVDDPAGDADDMPFGGVLDDPSASSGQALGKLEPDWQHQPGPAAPPGPDRLAEDLREGGDVAGQAPSFLGAS